MRHEVTGNNRLPGAVPASRHRRSERPTLADLVLDAFVQHDERVRRGADADDEAGHASEVERVTNPAAEEHE